MERRLLLVFVLTFLVILVMQPILKKILPQQSAEEPKKTETTPAPPPASQPPAAVTPLPTAKAAVAGKQANAESTTTVENDLYRIEFSNRGAQVKSWVLKKFDNEKGKPLELVNSAGAAKYGFPMSLWTYDENLRNKLNSALYMVNKMGTAQAPDSISFEYADDEVQVRKSFRFDHTYVVKVESGVTYRGGDIAAYPAWPAGFGDETVASSYAAARIDWQYADKIE